MPTRDQVLQVPFVGSIDEYTDPDQLQPPTMASLENAVVRKTGRIEKREGFEYIQKTGVPGTPAQTFAGTALPVDMQALSAYSGKDGSKLLLAAGDTLFEYVGSDADHGYRAVNKLPSCYGTLHPVDSTGGEVIEVESMLSDDGQLRCTVWVLGYRNGQDLTNDRAVSTQPVGTHGVYAAVQRVSDGAFVTAPVRIKDSFGNDTTRCSDLRMAMSRGSSGNDRHWVVAFRRDYSVIEAFAVISTSGSIKSTDLIQTPFTGRPYWRSFDITGVYNEQYMLFAYCEPDTSPASSDVLLKLLSFDVTTGAFSIVHTYGGGVLDAANAYGSTTYSVHDWNRRTPRGVVLESSPVTSTVAISVRTVHEMDTAPLYLDGKFVVTRANCSTSTISIAFDEFAWLHRSGFQTEDSFALFSTGAMYQSKYSGSSSATGTRIYPFVYSALTSPLSVVTAEFDDGSVQTYSLSLVVQGSLTAYNNPTIFRGSPSNTRIVNSGVFANQLRQLHQYPSDNSVNVIEPNNVALTSIDDAAINQRNVTSVRIAGANVVSLALANSVRFCRLSSAAGVKCLAVIAFDAAGIPVEVDLYDGRGDVTANVLGAPALTDIISIETRANPYSGAWGAPIAVPPATIRVFDDFNSAVGNTNTSPVFNDIGANTQPVAQTIVETSVGVEQCVHRWDVATVGNSIILAVSSVSAATFSGPNGDAPLGYVSPFARSNYFEVYPWVPAFQTRWDLNDYATTGSSVARPIWCAVGGPWRMTGGLVKLSSDRYGCVLMPGGDDLQRSSFFVSFTNGEATVQTSLDPIDGTPVQYAGGVVYDGNKGVFVESMNMPRTAAVPLNCPRFSSDGAYLFSLGAIRQGQNVGGSDIFALDYSFSAKDWRSMKQWGDYTVVNGGIPSSFDGSSCSEVAMLLWPQRDLTSIAYEPDPALLYDPNAKFSPGNLWTLNSSAYRTYSFGGPFLINISRPWFAYEAGFKAKNEFTDEYLNPTGIDTPMYWSRMSTNWGGDPTKDYQSVYADPRLMQVTGGKYNSGVGLSQLGNKHYYGRYQSGYGAMIDAGYSVKLSLWAPRAAATVSSVENSVYTPTVANGDFLACWCYESVDGTGRVVRSAPSQAVTFSVCSYITYKEYEPDPSSSTKIPVNGGDIDEYRYGFFAPRMELTNRLKTADSDSRRVVLQPYFTAEPFATVFYKVPFSNFLTQYSNDFTISRNATRGVVPYSSSNAGGPGDNPYGLATNNFRCFDGPQGDYNGLLSQPVLYTVGGGLDNVAPPSALCMTVHQNRLVLGGADDATVVWFSKELSPTDAPGFNDALTIQIEDGGAVTGLASLESLLIIFKRGMTWLVPGDMPDDTGSAVNRGYVSNTLGTPVRMPHGIGCVDHRSVIETPVGVFFKSERSIELLARDMSITPVGLKLDDTLSYYTEITSAIHNPKDTEVWFALRDPNNTTSILFAVFNYTTDVWSKHFVDADAFNPATLPMTIMDNNVYFATAWIDPLGIQPEQTVVYKQTESKFFDVTPEGRKYVLMSGQTAPIALNNVQGYQRLKRIRLMGSPIPTLSTGAPQSREPHGMQIGVLTDYAPTGVNNGQQLATWTEAEADQIWAAQNKEVYEVHLREQKGQKVSLGFQETAPADINALAHGYGTAFSNMAFVVGLKAGLDKRITAGAKH
ncbi:MAG: hypothetical protein EBR82_14875 [Caulobacteraceae bacterium]|nr:hypothetical protein [Caulobacteraceae bacterium]